MRAFMSGPNEFGTANDYCRHCAAEEESPNLRYNASATEAWTHTKQLIAEREARAILAETEHAVWGDAKTLTFLGAFHEERYPDFPCIDCAAGHALAEALQAFIEQES